MVFLRDENQPILSISKFNVQDRRLILDCCVVSQLLPVVFLDCYLTVALKNRLTFNELVIGVHVLWLGA